ncbi:MAG TPA: NUDIX hydrolase [Bacillota bacterium]
MEPTIEICAGGVVIKDGKVVAIKRKNGVWLMPKGHVDPGETLEEAALREVREETGLVARAGVKLGETEYTHQEDGRPHHKKVHWFYMEAVSGEPTPEPEMFTDLKLLDEKEIELLSFEHDRKLARLALTLMKKGKG